MFRLRDCFIVCWLLGIVKWIMVIAAAHASHCTVDTIVSNNCLTAPLPSPWTLFLLLLKVHFYKVPGSSLLWQYGAFMILILVAEIAVGVTAYAMKDRARSETKKFLSSTIKDYYATPEQTDAVTLMWNGIMKQVNRRTVCLVLHPLHTF